jgi:hypothetical protein
MKNLFLLLTILLLMISCQKKKIDWSEVILPIPLDSIAKSYEVLPYLNYNTANMESYKSFDKNLLFFKNTALDGKVMASNSIVMYVSKKDEKIVAVSLFTEDEKNTDKLLKTIEENLGKTDYHYFYNENKKLTVTQKIWKKGNKYYTLNLHDPDYILGKKTKTASFTIFNSTSDIFLKWWFYDGGDFSGFYGQYLDEKKKPEHINKNYNYSDFIEQMDKKNKNDGTTARFYVK